MDKSIQCYTINWEEAYRLARTVSHKIIESGFEPDIVIAVSRGGLVPARMVCDLLLHNNLTTIRTEHWDTASKHEIARIKFSLPKEADVSGKKVLIMDDVADTGGSFSVIIDYLNEKDHVEIRTAVLHYKTCSTVIPDYWGEEVKDWNWIIYPWAFYEDLAGFVEELLSRPMTAEELRKGLIRNFNITMSRKGLLKMLGDLSQLGKIKKSEKNKKILWERLKS